LIRVEYLDALLVWVWFFLSDRALSSINRFAKVDRDSTHLVLLLSESSSTRRKTGWVVTRFPLRYRLRVLQSEESRHELFDSGLCTQNEKGSRGTAHPPRWPPSSRNIGA
jgi:hypothetical protein